MLQSAFSFSEGVIRLDQQVAGVDEAGRGPLAGAVYAAAVILPGSYELPYLNDSKKLTERRREVLYDAIVAQAVSYSIACVEPIEIDRLNIYQATLLAMRQAVTALAVQPAFVYVDGNVCPRWSYASEALVQGDSRLDCIALHQRLGGVRPARAHITIDVDKGGLYRQGRHGLSHG